MSPKRSSATGMSRVDTDPRFENRRSVLQAANI